MYCTNCSFDKHHPRKAKGKFGLGYVLETPFNTTAHPKVWEVEINDTPSEIENTCDRLLKWINSPPILVEQPEINRKCNCTNHNFEEINNNFQYYRADLDHNEKGKETKSQRRSRSKKRRTCKCTKEITTPKKTKPKYNRRPQSQHKPQIQPKPITKENKPATVVEPVKPKESEPAKPATSPAPVKPASDPVTTETVIEPQPVRRAVTDLELRREAPKPEVEPAKPIHIPKLSRGELLDRLRKQRKRMEYAIHPEKFDEEPPPLPPLESVDKSLAENKTNDNEAKRLYQNINDSVESIEAIVRDEYDVVDPDE